MKEERRPKGRTQLETKAGPRPLPRSSIMLYTPKTVPRLRVCTFAPKFGIQKRVSCWKICWNSRSWRWQHKISLLHLSYSIEFWGRRSMGLLGCQGCSYSAIWFNKEMLTCLVASIFHEHDDLSERSCKHVKRLYGGLCSIKVPRNFSPPFSVTPGSCSSFNQGFGWFTSFCKLWQHDMYIPVYIISPYNLGDTRG